MCPARSRDALSNDVGKTTKSCLRRNKGLSVAGLPTIREGGRSKGKPPPWAEMILICEKRFLAPVATMLVIMRVVKHEFDYGGVQSVEQGFLCLCDRRVDEKCCAATVQLLEPRIELRLTEMNIIHTRRRSDAIHPSTCRTRNRSQLSRRRRGVQCSMLGGILAEWLAGRPFLIRPSTGHRGRITPFSAPKQRDHDT
jgi:hypothetical protein